MSASNHLLWITIGIYYLNLLFVYSSDCATNCSDCIIQSQCDANTNCLWNSKCLSLTHQCPHITIPSLNRAIPMDKCMKLNHHSNEYTLYTCYNNTPYTQTHTDSNCLSSPISVTTAAYYNYNCYGNMQSCTYAKLSSYDTCNISHHSNHTITYELTDAIYPTSATTNYTSTCSEDTYSILTQTKNGTDKYTSIPHAKCMHNERIFVDECHDEIAWSSDVNCGFVYDDDNGYAVPLNTCNIRYDEAISYEYYCADNKIYKCMYDGVNCDGLCVVNKYIAYDYAQCNMDTICPNVRYNKYDNCQQSVTETISIVVDVCISDHIYNISTMWKCKAHSMAKYVYDGVFCEDARVLIDEIQEFEHNKCVTYEAFMRMEIVSCSSPKCKSTGNNDDSYAMCNIFDATNVDQVIPFWDTYSSDYCEWFAEDTPFTFNMYQCNEYGLTLSLATNTMHGTLDTTHYIWPNDLHRLNLNDLNLNGEWNWWALQSDKLQYIDISNNNFTGGLQLFPLLYSSVLQVIKISNNPFMFGYIDWVLLGYITTQRSVNAFMATGIAWNGYADFTLLPDDRKVSIALDTNYQCDPYKYLCKHPLSAADRSSTSCHDKSTCEATCKCSDGSLATATHFPYTPVLGVISCGDVIDSNYELIDRQTRNLWGDDGHYYLLQIPHEYGADDKYINVTIDATHSSYFNGRIIIYSLDDVTNIHDSNGYEPIYIVDNPLRLTVALKAGSYYYLQIIASNSVNHMDCVNVYNDDEYVDYTADKYWYWYKAGFYKAGYQCDYSSYHYSISMAGCTLSPTSAPTTNPTSFYSTTSIVSTYKIVIFDTSEYDDAVLINDVYARLEISMQVYVKSEVKLNDKELGEHFEWLLQNGEQYISLNEYYDQQSDITFYNTKTGSLIIDGIVYDVFSCYVIIASIRTEHAGYCPDKQKKFHHVFQPGNEYKLKLNVVVNDEIAVKSANILLITHSGPSGGQCEIYHDGNGSLRLRKKYSVDCTGWDSFVEGDKELRYNVLYGNVPIIKEFIPNPLEMVISGAGDAVITVLVQDTALAVSCYDVILQFPELNVSDINALSDEIAEVIDTGIDNKIDVVSIFSTIRAVFTVLKSTDPLYTLYMQLTDKLFDGLFKASDTTPLQDKLQEISMLIAATNSEGYIGFNALNMLTYKYTNNVLHLARDYVDVHAIHHINALDEIDNIETDNTEHIDLYAMAVELHRLIQNLERYVSTLDAEAGYIHNLNSVLVENALHASYLALLDSYPGEIFTHEMAEKHVLAQKFATHFDANNSIKCGFQNEFVTIPTVINTQNAVIDCSLIKFNNTISVNLYGKDSHLPINSYQKTSQCEPYLITFHNTNFNDNDYELYENTLFPECKIWNNSFDEWSENNCFVYDINNDSVTCGCTGLGTHRIFQDEFILIPSVIAAWNWREISSQNFHKHYIVWITIGILLITIIFLSGLKWVDKTINRPILAYEDVIFIKKRNERMKNDIAGKEILYIEKYLTKKHIDINTFIGSGICKLSSTISLCNLFKLHSKLYFVYIANVHLFLSIFLHPSGTNISVRTRIGLLFMYLCNVFALMSVYYGLNLDNEINKNHFNIVNNIALQLILFASIFSLFPVYCLQELFVKSQPKTVRKRVCLSEETELKKMHSLTDELDDESILDYLRDSHQDRITRYEQSNLNEKYAQSLQRLKRNSINEKISTLDIAVEELRKANSNVHRLQLVDDVRVTLLNSLYPLPHFCKSIAWFLLIMWTCFVSTVAILFSLQFDLKYSAGINTKNTQHLESKYQHECWQNNNKLLIESQLSYTAINELNHKLSETHSASVKWLIYSTVSIIIFLFIFQPFWVYITTWIKIWMFSYNLHMKISIKNVCLLVHKVCCCTNKREDIHINERKHVPDKSMTSMTRTSDADSYYNYIVHPDRTLDVFGYLCNDDLFLRIDTKSGKMRAIDENEEEQQIICDIIDNYDDEQIESFNDDENESVIIHDIESQHGRQISYTDLSVTVTENGDMFSSAELAMMRVAAGNIFDYKTDVIQEGDEEEEESNVFSFDLNSDGIEESNDTNDTLSYVSQSRSSIDISNDGNSINFEDFDDLKINTFKDGNERSETDDGEDENDENENDNALINAIASAIKDIDDENKQHNNGINPKSFNFAE